MKLSKTIHFFFVTLIAFSFALYFPAGMNLVHTVSADVGGDSGGSAGGDSGGSSGGDSGGGNDGGSGGGSVGGDSGGSVGGDSGGSVGGDSGGSVGGDSGADGGAPSGGDGGGGGEPTAPEPPGPPGPPEPPGPPGPPTPPPPTDGGGPGGSGPGGLNPPNVVLFSQPGAAPLAFVTLSQIPYTGFAGGPIEQGLFWGFLLLWSFTIAYLFAVKRVGRNIRDFFFALAAPTSALKMSAMSEVAEAPEREEEEERFVPSTPQDIPRGYMATPPERMTRKAEAPLNLPTESAAPFRGTPLPEREQELPREKRSGISPLGVEKTIEEKAHENACLISKEGCTLLAAAAEGKEGEAVSMLYDVIEKGRKTYPKEDGWLLLNANRIEALLGGSSVPSPTQSTTTIPLFIGWLSEGARDKAFAYIRSLAARGESVSNFMAEVAAELDRALRSRFEGGVEVDAHVREKTARLGQKELESLIEALVSGADGMYSSEMTAAKLAIGRALALFGAKGTPNIQIEEEKHFKKAAEPHSYRRKEDDFIRSQIERMRRE